MRSSTISLLSLAGTTSALALKRQDNATAASPYYYFPVDFAYGVNSRFTSNLTFGTESDPVPVQVVLDTGSANFWTWQPNANVSWGSPYLGVIGPCSEIVPTGYDPSASSTAVLVNRTTAYAYAGNAKLVSGKVVANDTVEAVGGTGAFPNVQFALEDYALIRQLDDGSCRGVEYDKGIMGLAPSIVNDVIAPGPLFRKEMHAAGALASEVMFFWMDKFTGALGQTLTGGLLFSAVDSSKYSGDLVRVPSTQDAGSVGVYVPKPNVTFNGHTVTPDSNVTCLVDSGAHADTLPFAYDGTALAQFYNQSGGLLVDHSGIVSYNGTCDSIPSSLNITYTFPAVTDGETISIDIPLRNFARGYNFSGTEGLCLLNLEDSASCVLGATFLTGAVLALDDADGSVALAQGGVSEQGAGVDEASLTILTKGQSYDSV